MKRSSRAFRLLMLVFVAAASLMSFAALCQASEHCCCSGTQGMTDCSMMSCEQPLERPALQQSLAPYGQAETPALLRTARVFSEPPVTLAARPNTVLPPPDSPRYLLNCTFRL